ncbi:hypothetical protein LSH36_188g09078 [Paralvinella palmiformis]|uniref:Uncharacterized protein n=1 Tax=Paralvinella palmiformis TaxID=53620 RepID=A0AAD9JQL9_9ANNE|nr:hypothetical protein LSH36_188g09078 [Paralvinella palmiformis]
MTRDIVYTRTGVNRYYENLKDMIGYYPFIWWKICWAGFTPLICMGVFLFSCIQYKPITYAGKHYPWWGELVGWIMALSSIIVIPIYAIYLYIKTPGTFRERMKLLFRPDVDEPIKKNRNYITDGTNCDTTNMTAV